MVRRPVADAPTLENVHVASDRDLVDTRFPVQYVVRPKSDEFHDYRGYAGRVAGGVLQPGDDVLVPPSGMTSKIEGIDLSTRRSTRRSRRCRSPSVSRTTSTSRAAT